MGVASLSGRNGRAAQSRDAAAKLSRASGMGVTQWTHDTYTTLCERCDGDGGVGRTTYWANVPSTVNPLFFRWAQSRPQSTDDSGQFTVQCRRTLLEPLATRLTITTTIREPLDPHTLPKLYRRRLDMRRDGDDLADAFVPADEGRHRRYRPILPADVEIGVADAGADEFDEALARGEGSGLGDGDGVLEDEGLVGAGDECGDLGLGDGVRHHDGGEEGICV